MESWQGNFRVLKFDLNFTQNTKWDNKSWKRICVHLFTERHSYSALYFGVCSGVPLLRVPLLRVMLLRVLLLRVLLLKVPLFVTKTQPYQNLFAGQTLCPKQLQMEVAASCRQKAKFTSVKYRHDGIIWGNRFFNSSLDSLTSHYIKWLIHKSIFY